MLRKCFSRRRRQRKEEPANQGSAGKLLLNCGSSGGGGTGGASGGVHFLYKTLGLFSTSNLRKLNIPTICYRKDYGTCYFIVCCGTMGKYELPYGLSGKVIGIFILQSVSRSCYPASSI